MPSVFFLLLESLSSGRESFVHFIISFSLFCIQKLGVTADTTSYNILLKSCCLAGRVDLAKNIYKEVKCLESAGALKLDVFTYSTLIKVLSSLAIMYRFQMH